MRPSLMTILSAAALFAWAVNVADGRQPHEPATMSGPCGEVAANAADFLRWVRLTRVHPSTYASTMRANMDMPAGDSTSVVAVSDSATCASLALTLARAIAGRDTVTPNPVYALAVDTTLYLVVDFQIDSRKSADSAVVGSARYYGPSYTHALTVTRATGATRIWEYEIIKTSATPY